MKKAFQRKCMSCNTKKDKCDLVRIVRTTKNEIIVDKTGKMDGRGAYICSNIDCLNKAIKTDKIFKVLKSNINKKIYEDIRGVILERESKNT